MPSNKPRQKSSLPKRSEAQLNTKNHKLITLIGPTSSGKSELAVLLAKKFNGEIISCDSRQIYQGMDIGSGKVIGNWKLLPIPNHPERSASEAEGSIKKNPKSYILHPTFIYKSIPHHCIDFVSPKKRYSVSLFKKQADKAIKDILSRGKVPILCGGTAQYVDAVIYNQIIPEVKPNLKLRAKLEKYSDDALFNKLKKLDPARAETIDRFNKRRLIRALEIVVTTGKPVPTISYKLKAKSYNTLWLGITQPQEVLYKKIEKRLKERFKQGMIKEVQNLHSLNPKSKIINSKSIGGLSWEKLESFGLEYKYIALYLQKKLTYEEMFTQLLFAIKHYTKRQMTWWKRNQEIHWIENKTQAEKIVKTFIYSASPH
jgi:tRNA dimethylallyltransferase